MKVCNEPLRDSHGFHRPIYVNRRYRVTAHATSRLVICNAESELAVLDQAAIRRWSDRIYEAWDADKSVFVFGNGGAGTSW